MESDDTDADRESDAALRPVDLHGTPLPVECLDALDVVDYLAHQCGDDRRCKPLDVARIVSRIAPGGVDWNDVDGSAGHFSPAEARRSLRRRSGPAFEWLAHAGYMYWRTKGTWCTSDETGVIVHLAETYELSFDVAHLLRAIHYLVHEYE